MDRRKFLGKAPIAGAATLVGIKAADGTRLYGQPASISPAVTAASPSTVVDSLLPSLFRIHAALDGSPSAYSPARLAACRTALAVLNSQSTAQAFLESPDSFLNRTGDSVGGSLDKTSFEYGMVAALASPAVRSAAAKGDAVAFINAMQEAKGTAQPDLLPPAYSSSFILITTYVHLAAVATLSVVAVAVVIAAVVVLVAGAVAPIDNEELAIAAAVGGASFASDVASTKAQAEIAKVMAGIESGAVQLPEGVSKEMALSSLKTVLERHMIVAAG